MSEILVYLLATIVIVIVLLLVSRITKLKEDIKDLKEQRSMYVELNLELRHNLVYYCDGTKITKFKPCYNDPNQVELNSRLTLPIEQVKLIYNHSDVFLFKVCKSRVEEYQRLIQDTHIKDMLERWVNTSNECSSMFLDDERESGILHSRVPKYVNLNDTNVLCFETTHVLELLDLSCDGLEAIRSQLVKLTGWAAAIEINTTTPTTVTTTLDVVKWDSFMEAVRATCEECKKIDKTDMLFHLYDLKALKNIDDYRSRLKGMATHKVKSISESTRIQYATDNPDRELVPDLIVTDLKNRTFTSVHSTHLITKTKLSELSQLYLQEDIPV